MNKTCENYENIYESNKVLADQPDDKQFYACRHEKFTDDEDYPFEQYPNSTYENVILVRNYLYKKNYNKILFITAPYHSKRSNLIWKKNAPNIKIINVPVVDNPETTMQWKTPISSIKVILYEYLAIIYNLYKKRL